MKYPCWTPVQYDVRTHYGPAFPLIHFYTELYAFQNQLSPDLNVYSNAKTVGNHNTSFTLGTFFIRASMDLTGMKSGKRGKKVFKVTEQSW